MRINFDKIIKIQLIFLLALVITSLVSFYFTETLPDNALVISSSNDSISFFFYYLTSIVSYVGYFTGPWLIIPFVLQTILYAGFYSKRYYKWDTLNFIPLVYICALVFLYFSPGVLGDGLHFILTEKISLLTLSITGALSVAIFFAGTFRSSFKTGFITLLLWIKNTPNVLMEKVMSFSLGRFANNFHFGFNDAYLSSKVAISKLLQGTSKRDYHLEEVGGAETVRSPRLHNFNPDKVERDFSQDESFGEHNSNESHSDKEFSQTEQAELDQDDSSQTELKQRRNSLANNTLGQKKYVKSRPSKAALLKEQEYYNIVNDLSKKKRSPNRNSAPKEKYFDDIINRIEDKLSEFKIDGEIIRVLKGPVVDTFELELGAGVKVSKVTRAEDDLSLALYGAPIRIVYPMIGRTTVGIEVPRKPRDVIFLDEVLESNEFEKSKATLPVAMGKDAFGETYVVDLAAMPHMLIAGATGAGKSVFINTLLVSLLVKKSPRQMQLILIDPKQLELALYANLPHLVVPVITDPKTAAISLMWAVQEMDRRYSILKDFGVRNLEGFNEKIKRATSELFGKIHHHYENADQDGYELPSLVIIIDEFADLILTKAGKEIESNVCRLAAKARAAGIHLVVATQRPSVDVITGLIKSNFPTRVSFRVTSSIDSRTILNTVGAEKLLGMGDMLYKHGTTNCRLHSAFVDEEEVELFTDSIIKIKPTFNNAAMDFLENGGEENDDPYAFGSHISKVVGTKPNRDEKYEEALQIVIQHRSASASMLQRKLGVGYNRASNLIDALEDSGIIGPAQGSKPRKIITAQDII
ncbi:MAG: DNA translocase FtsK [Bacteriovoracaceae bacterium]|nr:DNA translocase FtsK [Bacteriovoracaceae bacterium]